MGEAPGQKDTFAFVDTNSMPAWQPAGAPKTQVTGADSQVLTIMLDAGEEIQTEPGAMMHMSDGVQPDLGCAPNCCTRCCCLGESCWIAHYKNEGAHGYMAQLGGVELDKDVDCFSLTCCLGLWAAAVR